MDMHSVNQTWRAWTSPIHWWFSQSKPIWFGISQPAMLYQKGNLRSWAVRLGKKKDISSLADGTIDGFDVLYGESFPNVLKSACEFWYSRDHLGLIDPVCTEAILDTMYVLLQTVEYHTFSGKSNTNPDLETCNHAFRCPQPSAGFLNPRI